MKTNIFAKKRKIVVFLEFEEGFGFGAHVGLSHH